MVQNNYEILSIHEGATKKEIQEAFRKLALQHHSDRGGDVEEFKKIKQAYEDLKQGKKYPDSQDERKEKSRVYSGDDEEETRRRNIILAGEISKEMKLAEEWSAAHQRAGTTGTRLFGSKALGEMEFEKKANGTLSIKGNIMAGSLTYGGPIVMRGNVTSPSFSSRDVTEITLTRGDFKLVNPIENKYRIENGSRINALAGNIVAGDVFGRKIQVQDPDGRVGLYVTTERRTRLSSPRGKIVIENAVNTVDLEADTVIALNLEDDVKVAGREILIYGNKMTYDVRLLLKEGGLVRFFERNSVLGLSDDAIISLENGKRFILHDLKTRKIADLPSRLIPDGAARARNESMVGGGFSITYEMLDGLDKKPEREEKSGWRSRLGL